MIRELLKAAAKAAGLKIDKSSTNGGPSPNTGFDMSGNVVLDWHNGTTWNPLKDDGDALRLAVHLDMQVTVNRVDGFTEVVVGVIGVIELHGDDMYTVTRLAITKAAAEIGRRM